MNKSDLINAVATRTGVTKASAKKSIEAVLGSIVDCVRDGTAVKLLGFGSFDVVSRKARTGRNPKTGEQIKILASKSVKFSVGKDFKMLVNTKKKKR